MTVRVTAPNGATVQFPDGTSSDTIHGVMMQHFGDGAPSDAPSDIGDNRASALAALRGIPILGAYADKGVAALNAAAQPFTETGLSDAPTFSERMAADEAHLKSSTDAYEASHPIGTDIGKAALGGAAMAPLLMAAPLAMGAEGALGTRMAMGGLSNAVIGGADSAARGGSPITGAIVGGVTGAVLPGATEAIAHAAMNNPIVSNISARLNPEGFAQRQVARAISESGQTPQQIGQAVTDAAAEGQGEFTVGDAMGNAGQRMLSTVARAPGEGRTAVVDALEGRQGTQGRRISNALSEGFGSPRTAAQTDAAMTGARDTAADAEYGAVRNDAAPVDLVGPLNHIDQIIGTEPGQVLTAPNDSVESVMTGFRQRLARVNPDDFAAVQRIRGDMADQAQAAMQAGHGNRARIIGGAVRQLDAAMDGASPGFRQANANFRQASQNIDAIGDGRAAAMQGRTEDTIPAFQALPPEGQRAFRAGYVDPLIADVQKAAPGANKARPLLNDAFRTEAGAMAPGNPLMQRRLGREQTMFETRNQALGGSRTMDNQNDHAAMAIDPHLVGAVGHILHGNIGGAAASVGRLMANGWTGNTPQVRQQVARILLQRAPTMNRTTLENMVGQTVARLQRTQSIVRQLGRGAAGTLTDAGSGRADNSRTLR
jgi:hypothetical protein